MIRDAVHIPHVNSGSYPLREGCRVRPLVDGEPAFRRICEAVEAARSRVWITVAFIEPDVQMPDGRGSFFDVLDRAVARGIDVRVIFWRPVELDPLETGTHFEGSEEERRWLAERGSRFLARWDCLPGNGCQHQKSWLIDAGLEGEVGFVGGINLDGDLGRLARAPPPEWRQHPRRLRRAPGPGGDGRPSQLRAALERGQ